MTASGDRLQTSRIGVARMTPIYLDGFATMPLAPEVGAIMAEVWSRPGNPSSPHADGERAARLVADARESIAELINASSAEIIFTSGATEANNLALLGAATDASRGRNKIVVSAIEHKSVLESAEALRARGFVVVHAPVDRHGRIDIVETERLLDERTLMVSIMAVNNETGVVQPVEEIAARAHAFGALVHCDGAQAIGKVPIDVLSIGVDYLSISAHKMYGPMGLGALYVAASAPRLSPQSFGGGQQGGMRAGTEPVPLIVGFGEAARIASARMAQDNSHGDRLAAIFIGELAARQVRVRRITGDHPVVPGSLAIQFADIDAEQLCLAVSRLVSISTGSACTSGQLRLSHVLESMGYSEEEGRSIVRLFCHRYVDERQIISAAEAIASTIHRFR